MAVVAVILTLGAWPTPGVGDTPVAAVPEQGPEARAILLKMAEYIAEAPAFSATTRSGYDAIQEDGQRFEFGERRWILLKRQTSRPSAGRQLWRYQNNTVVYMVASPPPGY